MANDLPDWSSQAYVNVQNPIDVASGTITVAAVTAPISLAAGTIDVTSASIAVANLPNIALNVNPVVVPTLVDFATASGHVVATVTLPSVPALGDIVIFNVGLSTSGEFPYSVPAGAGLIGASTWQAVYLYIADGSGTTAFTFQVSDFMAIVATHYLHAMHQAHAQASTSPLSVTPTRNPWRWLFAGVVVSSSSIQPGFTLPAGFATEATIGVDLGGGTNRYVRVQTAALLSGLIGAQSLAFTPVGTAVMASVLAL